MEDIPSIVTKVDAIVCMCGDCVCVSISAKIRRSTQIPEYSDGKIGKEYETNIGRSS